MGVEITSFETIRQVETPVRGPDGANRFITVIGSMRVPIRGHNATETYTCLVGPVLEPHKVLGVSFLPSIAALDLHTSNTASVSMQSKSAEMDADSGQVEIGVELLSSGAVDNITLVFSLTILAAA
jgi:hypothetical protein